MNLINTFQFNEVIQFALKTIPKELHKFLGCNYILGSDPIALGFHSLEKASYNRSNRNTMHVLWDFGKNEQTLIIPQDEQSLEHVVHEFGHVLHFNTGYFEMLRNY